MNKMTQIWPEPPRISLDYAGYVNLGAFWNRRQLSGPFWRLYHHGYSYFGLVLSVINTAIVNRFPSQLNNRISCPPQSSD